MTTTWNKAQAERHQELAALWLRAGTLTAAETGRLCELVIAILQRCAKVNLATTEHEIEDLIHAYVGEKILPKLMTDPDKFRAQMPVNHGALIGFFQRFVISLARQSESRQARQADGLEADTGEIRAEVEGRVCQVDLVDTLQAQGFKVAALHSAAQAFLAGLTPVERAVVQNYCDADLSVARLFPNSPAQQSLARTAIAQMGLWYGRTTGRDLQKFARTRLGRFMSQQIGQPLDESHADAIQAVMSLICQLA